MPFTFVYGGTSIPAKLYQQMSEPLASLVAYNNSPVTFNVDDHPPAPLELSIAGIIPAFYAITIPLDGYTTFALLATSGAPLAGNSLNLQVYTQAEALQGIIAPPLAAPFGPGGWGPGAIPNSLQPVNPGDQFLAWQAQQFVNALTGIMTGQAFKLANSLELAGPSNALFLDDTDGIGADTVSTMLTAGQWLFQSSVASATILSLNELGSATPAATVATRIGAIVGANGQRLLNVVRVQGAAGLTASGTGAVVGGTLTFPVGQIPASTVVAWFDVNWTSAAVGDRITFFDSTASFNGGSFVTQVAGQEIDGALTVAQAAGGSNVVRYTITSAGAWSFGIVPHAYTQPT